MKITYLIRSIILIALVMTQSCTTKEAVNETEAFTSPAGENSEEPNLIKGGDGKLYLSWIERREDMAVLQYAKWEGTSWSAAEIIAQGSDWFVNWADYPAMAVNQAGDKIAHYLQMSDSGTYTYDIKVVGQKFGSTAWSAPIKLHSDSVSAEHGFVSMLPLADNRFFLSWLDGRNTVSEATHGHEGHGGGGAMSIMAAYLSADLDITEETVLDNRVCDCCQTTVAITANGPIVAYRDRSEEEIRDMSIIRLVAGEWTAPKTIHNDGWNIAGCPVNGPRSVADQDHLAIAWFTAAQGEAKVNVSISTDAGETFGEAVQLDQGNGIGRVDIDMIDSETLFVSWMEEDNLVGAKVSYNGEILKRYQLAASAKGRSSGFPQIALIGEELMIAWTDAELKQVRVKLVAL
jgi:hypothetical protein